VKWTNHTKRGYLRLTLERSGALAEFIGVSNVRSKEFRVSREAGFNVASSAAAGVAELTPVED
jgi:hypothetical protein